MEETNVVFLSDERKLILEDEDDIMLSLISNNTVESRYAIPYPSGSYGGGSLQLSPSKKFLIFSYFSGESEEAFALFKIENAQINLLYDSGYRYGEEASYSFVNDEKILIQTFRTGTWYEENAKRDKMGDLYYAFGELNLFNIETLELSRHTIHVYPTDNWKEEETDIGTFVFSDIKGSEFNVTMPWGKVTFYAPLENILEVRPKSDHLFVSYTD